MWKAKVADIRAVERHQLRCTALCDDGSAFFVPVAPDWKTVVGDVIMLTAKKIKKLAAIKPLKRERE